MFRLALKLFGLISELLIPTSINNFVGNYNVGFKNSNNNYNPFVIIPMPYHTMAVCDITNTISIARHPDKARHD